MVMVERDVSLSEILIIVRSSNAKAAAIPMEIAPVQKSFGFISSSDLLSSFTEIGVTGNIQLVYLSCLVSYTLHHSYSSVYLAVVILVERNLEIRYWQVKMGLGACEYFVFRFIG